MQFPTRPPTVPMAPATATATTTTTAVASPSTSFRPLRRSLLPPTTKAARCPPPPRCRGRLGTARQVVAADVSSSPSDVAAEEAAAAPKIGKRVRVMAPVRVHHVSKAPDLDLRGMEGVVKQYVGVWKGKRITANLPFKVEFELRVDGQDKPVRFFAHLREDEFELVGDE
ncbi:ferredoxin-thioredoxin reductase, variable chain [Oryza brachyantha]|uniref:ferredoxin-thioredoxin reductase, variable chain n=1 Tax=Oryza brachyantha TaxID=4533 RepID=UPI001ADB777B|nr:ferredoxin-thioredoxin reductase, variable chain [Oryza brachyantha]